MAGNNIRFGAYLDDHVSSNLSKIRDKFDLMGKGAASASLAGNVGAMALAKGVGFLHDAASKAVDVVSDSVKAASNLAETLSKSKVVFGASAKGIEEWGNTAARNLGISKQAAIEAAASFGNLFVGLDLSEQKAADMSKGIVTLAGDLASFNNLDPTEVLDKLRSGLSGEAEPLRRLGVYLTEAKVKAKAMEMGLADAKGELSESAKVLARYQLILDETGTAQGDFARTSDGMANQQRILNAEMQDTSAKLGGVLMPKVIDTQRAIIALADAFTTLSGAAHDAGLDLDFLTLSLPTWFISRWDMAWDHWHKGWGDATWVAQETEKNAKVWSAQIVADLDHIPPAMKDVGKAATDMGFTTRNGAWKSSDAITKFRDTAISAAKDLIDQAYGPIILQDKLKASGAELAANRAIIASKDSSKAQIADSRAIIHQLQMDQAGYLLALAETGDTSSKVYQDAIHGLETQVRKATGPTKEYLQGVLDKLREIDKTKVTADVNVKFHVAGGQKIIDFFDIKSGRASGGPVSAGSPYIVGEQGPEIFVPNSGGAIIPNGQPMPTGSPSGGYTFIYSPAVSTASAAEAERFSRALLPAFVREMRRQSVL